METIPIVLSTDDNFVIPTAVLINSICETNWDVQFMFYICTQTLTDDSQKMLKSVCGKNNVQFCLINSSYNAPIRKHDHVSLATYFRFFFPTVLPQNLRKVLYLDGDMICVDSLKELWNTDVTDYSGAFAIDDRNNDYEIMNRLSIPYENGYFNAGVMLINLNYWRKHNIQQKCIDYVNEHSDLCLWHDQDAMNVVLNGTYKHIHPRYNLLDFYLRKRPLWLRIDRKYFPEIFEARRNPCLIHFYGPIKPWHKDCKHPYRNYWFDYIPEQLKSKIVVKWKKRPTIKQHIRLLLGKTHIMPPMEPTPYEDITTIKTQIYNE